jgi:hypothetical protein
MYLLNLSVIKIHHNHNSDTLLVNNFMNTSDKIYQLRVIMVIDSHLRRMLEAELQYVRKKLIIGR